MNNAALMFIQFGIVARRTLVLTGALAALLVCCATATASETSPVRKGTLSVGFDHACAIKTDGTLRCWGDNTTGEINQQTGRFKRVAAGWNFTCAIKEAGDTQCWGDGLSGQTTPDNSFGPQREIVAGVDHACSVDGNDSRVICWGYNTSGQAGSPALVNTYFDAAAGRNHTCFLKVDRTMGCQGSNASNQSWVQPATNKYTEITAGQYFTCLTRITGDLFCQGEDQAGQSSPPGGQFMQIDGGSRHACGLRYDGTATCWGANNAGQSDAPSGHFLQISAGGDTSCAQRVNGTIVCWGAGGVGQTNVPSDLGTTGIVELAGGRNNTCAIRGDGNAFCWGANGSGQSTPPADLGLVRQLAAGENHVCAVKEDGTVRCWGADGSGRATVPGGLGIVRSVSAGADHTCAVKPDGSLVCWGSDAFEQLTPVGLSGPVSAVYAGSGFTCAREANAMTTCWGRNDENQIESLAISWRGFGYGYSNGCGSSANGLVWCWGQDTYGQLSGAPPQSNFYTYDYVQISGGAEHMCSLRLGGPAYVECWGSTSASQGQATPPASLTAVGSINAGGFHSCAVMVVGWAKCWGRSLEGQLGSSPTFTSGGVVWVPGKTFSTHTYTATPGVGNSVTFRVSSGSLPPGLTLTSGGVLSGAATQGGTFNFVVEASNGILEPAYQMATISINATAPPKPTLSFTPGSPSTSNNLNISGTAESGSTVRLYGSSDCTGFTFATMSASQFTGSGYNTNVNNDSSTTYSATATNSIGNVSQCSGPATFVNDQTAPAAPAFDPTDPASPSTSSALRLSGTAESGSTVSLFASGDCSGSAADTVSAAVFSSPGFNVTVSALGTATFSATATDGVGNVSECSGAVSYVRVAPQPPPAPLAGTFDRPKFKSKLAGSRIKVTGAVVLRAPGMDAAHCIGKARVAATVKLRGKTKRMATKSFALRLVGGTCTAKVSLKIAKVHRGKRSRFAISLVSNPVVTAPVLSVRRKI